MKVLFWIMCSFSVDVTVVCGAEDDEEEAREPCFVVFGRCVYSGDCRCR